jgi:ribosomal protein L31E
MLAFVLPNSNCFLHFLALECKRILETIGARELNIFLRNERQNPKSKRISLSFKTLKVQIQQCFFIDKVILFQKMNLLIKRRKNDDDSSFFEAARLMIFLHSNEFALTTEAYFRECI